MAYLYSSNALISGRLGRAVFSTTTTPTTAQVEAMENESVEYIDAYTRATFRAGQSFTETFNFRPTEEFQSWIDGLPFKLARRGITSPMTLVGGDSLAVHEGSSGYTEKVGVWTEGHNGQFWLDVDNGILYIKTNLYKRYLWSSLRVTYRHRIGSTVPGGIQEAATLLTALKVLETDRYGMSLPSTGEHTVNPQRLHELWWDRAHLILSPYVEVQGVSPLPP